jgi:hypothetical protein
MLIGSLSGGMSGSMSQNNVPATQDSIFGGHSRPIDDTVIVAALKNTLNPPKLKEMSDDLHNTRAVWSLENISIFIRVY